MPEQANGTPKASLPISISSFYFARAGKLPDHREMLWIIDTARGAVMHIAEEMRLRERVSELTK